MFADAIAMRRHTTGSLREDARLVFTAHSIPVAARSTAAAPIFTRARSPTRPAWSPRRPAIDDYDQVWQSRSGPPQVPWLEPDVADHLTALAERGTRAVIVCPIGFVADHIEVVWDLDHELRRAGAGTGCRDSRGRLPPTPHPRFARLAVDLIDEVRNGREPARMTGRMPQPLPGFSIDGALCTPDCGTS